MITVIVAFKMSRFFDDLQGTRLHLFFVFLIEAERADLDGSIV